MNKNLNLAEILKNCHKGTKLYSLIFGEVEFERIDNSCGTIKYKTNTGRNFDVSYEGKFSQIMMENVHYSLQKTNVIGVSSKPLAIRISLTQRL